MLTKLKSRGLFACVAVASLLTIGAPSALATDYGRTGPNCGYKTVIVYETVLKPHVTWVKKHDHCGQAYWAKSVSYTTVRVPVEKQVRIHH